MPIKPSTVILGRICPVSCSPPGHGPGHGARRGSVRRSVQRQCRCLRHRCRPVPLRGSGPWRIRLDHFARRRLAIQTRLLLPCSQILLRFRLPAGAIPWGSLDQLLPAMTCFTMVSRGVMLRGAPWMLPADHARDLRGHLRRGGPAVPAGTWPRRRRRSEAEGVRVSARVDRAVPGTSWPSTLSVCRHRPDRSPRWSAGDRASKNHPGKSGGSGPDRGRIRGFTGAVRRRIHACRAGSWKLSVDENVAFVGVLTVWPDVLTTRAGDLLTRAGLSDVRDRLAGSSPEACASSASAWPYCTGANCSSWTGQAPAWTRSQPGGAVASDRR